MIVNKSMFPLQTGFGVISKMQSRFATLQMQLGTGDKASKLSEMGRDLPMSLSVRARLSKIEGFSANIDTVNLRLSFLDKTMTRMDAIEAESRNSAVQGQYGTNNINMATLPGLSRARLDELVTLLNADVAGRYLFGGANTDSAPLPDTTSLLEGIGGKDGFKSVVGERKAADAGADGLGRLKIDQPTTNSVSLTEDGIHPFGFKLLRVTSTAPATSVNVGTLAASPVAVPQLGNTNTITFEAPPAEQMLPGQTITLGLQLPDGSDTQITLTAIAPEDAPPGKGQFVVDPGAAGPPAVPADPAITAGNFKAALEASLEAAAGSDLEAASTFAAAEMFFNGPGEPALRVDGDPATATALKVATDADTVLWYRGQSPAVAAEGMGRLGIQTAAGVVTLQEKAPTSSAYGFQITGVSADTTNIDTTYTGADPSSVAVAFTDTLTAGEKVSVTLKEPNGTTRTVELTAVTGKAVAGQFSISTNPDPIANANENAENFAKGLKLATTEAAAAAEGNPRQSVTAQVDDSTRVAYGIEANESGLLRMIRTIGALSVETYPDADPNAKARFDAMAQRQQAELSESHNSERGSIEVLTMELAVAQISINNSAERHTNYKAQLDNLLSDVETVSKEDVAMEILALQTRLQASYQATSMVSQLSLVNFI
jgi:flagellin-like hook-associated protein FlgL